MSIPVVTMTSQKVTETVCFKLGQSSRLQPNAMAEGKLLKEEITSYYSTKGAKGIISTLLSSLLQVENTTEDILIPKM